MLRERVITALVLLALLIPAVIAASPLPFALLTIVLIGAELNAEMEHQTKRDTTTGAEKPLGARGANKADTVAPT